MSTKKLLYEYPSYKQSIQNIRQQILSLNGTIDRIYPNAISNYDFETPPNYSNEFHSTTERYAIKNLDLEEKELHKLERALNEYMRVTNAIEKALDNLREKERKVIELRYFQKKNWLDIDEEIAERTGRLLVSNALKQLDIELKYINPVI